VLGEQQAGAGLGHSFWRANWKVTEARGRSVVFGKELPEGRTAVS
jgi:hypothetical protein